MIKTGLIYLRNNQKLKCYQNCQLLIFCFIFVNYIYINPFLIYDNNLYFYINYFQDKHNIIINYYTIKYISMYFHCLLKKRNKMKN